MDPKLVEEMLKPRDEEIEELKRQKDALMEELENIATAEWREFDPDTRRCAYEFVLWAQSRARHTISRVMSGDVTKPLPEDAGLVQVGDCSCSDHECGECMRPAEEAPRWRDVVDELPQEAQEVLFVRGGKTVHGAWIGGIFWHSNQKMAAATWMPLPKPPKVGAGETAKSAECDCLSFWESHHPECPTLRHNRY